ncbi:sialidase family protein [Dyadobacter sp. LHD-138]|uniref:sialidase family protein n=1 Tax=Dyadobacter sp. LHD-138 TaxID=3071413 RepID=UPI0027E1E44D|nr:sialidase family protein [Dyadobacter sp. LHD-138]MDQ6478144.1 sialidase family protein [Dyadobacter sp. LHD-138]
MKKTSFLLVVIAVIFSAYRFANPSSNIDSGPKMISLPKGDASGAYLTTDQSGNPVLSWVQKVSADQYKLYYAVSKDGGRSFSGSKEIPTSRGIYPHDENLSKIIFKRNGDMLAIFAVSNPSKENKYAGLLYYTQSFDKGATWTEPKQLSPAKSYSNDERYFDMTLLPDGEIGVVWLDSRKPAQASQHHHEGHHEGMSMEGSALYFSKTEQKEGFVNETRVAESTCQCCRTKLYSDKMGKLHLTYRAILNDSIRDMVHAVSMDNGKNFSRPKRISADNWVIRGCPHTGPTMTGNQQGMHFAWYTMGSGKGIYYCNSSDANHFTARQSVSASASAKHPQMVVNMQGQLAIVWDELTEEGNFRIGLQTRTESGNLMKTGFITAANINATHPVALASGQTGLLVAYTKKEGDRSQVFYDFRQLSR